MPLFGRHGGRVLLQFAVASVVLGGAAVAGAAATGVFAGDASRASFQVLSRPSVTLPTETRLVREAGGQLGVDAHLALQTADLALYAVASRDGKEICLTVGTTDGTVDTCRSRSQLTSDDAIWIKGVGPDGNTDLYGLVPDGIDSVQVGTISATPANNAFVLRDIPASNDDLVVDGPGVHNDIRIGPALDATTPTMTTVTVPATTSASATSTATIRDPGSVARP